MLIYQPFEVQKSALYNYNNTLTTTIKTQVTSFYVKHIELTDESPSVLTAVYKNTG